MTSPDTINNQPVELLHAQRPVEPGSWFSEFAYEGWQVAGAGLGFIEPEELVLTIVGSGEVHEAIRHFRKNNTGTMPNAVKRAKLMAPDSFRQPLEITPAGLTIRPYTDQQVKRLFLVAIIGSPLSTLANEKQAVTRGLDKEYRRFHNWQPIAPVVKLAQIQKKLPDQRTLDELSQHLPATIQTSSGKIETVLE